MDAQSLKVLHVYRTYFPDTQGGLEEVIRQICESTLDLGVECRVFATSAQPSSTPVEFDRHTVVQTQSDFEIASCNFSLEALKKFKDEWQQADLVHYHFPWPFADLLHFATRCSKPSVVTYHSDIVRQRLMGAFYGPLMNRFLDSVDRIVCTSPNYFATSEVLSKFGDKVDVIPIGISSEHYSARSLVARSWVRSNFGSDYFLFVGVMRYYKGLHILLDAARNADYKIVLVGSGPTEKELKAQAEKLGIDNVVFAGQVSDEVKHELFREARGVVFPSYLRSEAFGVTLLEGAMHGKPMISTEVGSGTSHVNIHGDTGLVIPPGSHVSLRKAMDYMWANVAEARKMGANARARYEKYFTAELMGARYHQLYRNVLKLPQQERQIKAIER